jgi:4-carboxymuconolactone decarboxylase
LIESREQATPEQQEVYDHIGSTRGGQVGRPFAILLQRPEIARAMADLGTVIRFQSTLSDHDRELVIVTTAIERDCDFEWQAHRSLASSAGVSERTLDAVAGRSDATDDRDARIVAYVRALARTGSVENDTYGEAQALFGDAGVVEMTAIVGYYTLLAMVMNAAEAC